MQEDDNLGFLPEKTHKDFIISDEEIFEACDDIDLDSIANKEDLDELEGLTFEKNHVDSDACSSEDYNADVEDDESNGSKNSNYGIALDSDIVKTVLDGSDDRRRSRTNEKFKNYCKYSIILFLGFAGFLTVFNSDYFVYRGIQQHGSAFYMNDGDNFLEAQTYNVFDKPVQVSYDYSHLPDSYKHFKDVRGPAYLREKETPLFVGCKDGSTVIEDVVSDCLGLTIAGTKPVPDRYATDKNLLTYISEESGRAYVNVDLSGQDGLHEARKAGLASSSLADVIFSPQFHGIGNIIFHDEFKARLFTLTRHPVDLAVTSYYKFTQTAAEEVLREMSLEEFISSKYYVGNIMTRLVGGCWTADIADSTCLQWSKELLRTKYIIGLHDDIYGAIELYEDYFFWDNASPDVNICKRNAIKSESDRDFAVYKKTGHKIKENSKLYQQIVEQNALDMELYWFAVELQKFQRAWVPRLTANN